MYTCPNCRIRPAETVASVYILKGFLIWYQKGHATVAGCVPCVRGALLGEIPSSLGRIILFPPGWIAVPVFVLPFLLIHAIRLKPEPDAVIRVSEGQSPRTEAFSRARILWILLLVLAAIAYAVALAS